jgi:O-methyltransferase
LNEQGRLYIDLLKRILTNLIYQDPNVNPPYPTVFDHSLRAIGRDHPRDAHTMVGMARLNNLHMLAERVLETNVPGDFVETGVWRGGASIFLRGVLKAHGINDRHVWLADSFAGLPKPNLEKYPLDKGWDMSSMEYLKVSLAQVQEHFRRYDLLDDQVKFLEGWFKDTLPAAPIKHISILRLDGDLYESTMDSLTSLYSRVSRGGYVIVDDYLIIPPCRSAVDEFRTANGIPGELIPIDRDAVYWQKQ